MLIHKPFKNWKTETILFQYCSPSLSCLLLHLFFSWKSSKIIFHLPEGTFQFPFFSYRIFIDATVWWSNSKTNTDTHISQGPALRKFICKSREVNMSWWTTQIHEKGIQSKMEYLECYINSGSDLTCTKKEKLLLTWSEYYITLRLKDCFNRLILSLWLT